MNINSNTLWKKSHNWNILWLSQIYHHGTNTMKRKNAVVKIIYLISAYPVIILCALLPCRARDPWGSLLGFRWEIYIITLHQHWPEPQKSLDIMLLLKETKTCPHNGVYFQFMKKPRIYLKNIPFNTLPLTTTNWLITCP